MKRLPTGITNFDPLLDGGFPEGTTTLLMGPTGAGKTIFGLQYLYNGITMFDDTCIYITLETRPDDLRLIASQFGWSLSEFEKSNKFIIIDGASSKAQLPTSEKYALKRGFDMESLAEMAYDAIVSTGAKRLVLDSIAGLIPRFDDSGDVRRDLYRISSLLNELKVTSLFIGELESVGAQHRHGIGTEQFVMQGFITLHISEGTEGLERSLLIRKMRYTSHSMKRHRFEIGKNGIRVLGNQKPPR